MSDDDYLFLWLSDLSPEDIERRIVQVLKDNDNLSRQFRELLAAMFDRSGKKLPFKARMSCTSRHRPRKSQSEERAAAALKSLEGASRGQGEGILQKVADDHGVKLRTIYADLKAQREREELWTWMTEKK